MYFLTSQSFAIYSYSTHTLNRSGLREDRLIPKDVEITELLPQGLIQYERFGRDFGLYLGTIDIDGQMVPALGGNIGGRVRLISSDPDTIWPSSINFSTQLQKDNFALDHELQSPTQFDDRLIAMIGDFDDVLSGGLGNDSIVGHGGNDVLMGNAGFDIILGGEGNDTILGGHGGGDLSGEGGNDWIKGGRGDDNLDGGRGKDSLITGVGQDRLLGGGGDDYLSGGSGDDWLEGGTGNDKLIGGLGHDRLEDRSGENRFFGGARDDELRPGDSESVLVYSTFKDEGTDTIFVQRFFGSKFQMRGGDISDLTLLDRSPDEEQHVEVAGGTLLKFTDVKYLYREFDDFQSNFLEDFFVFV